MVVQNAADVERVEASFGSDCCFKIAPEPLKRFYECFHRKDVKNAEMKVFSIAVERRAMENHFPLKAGLKAAR